MKRMHSPANAAPRVEELFEQHVSFVWRVLEHHGLRGADVEDATQEVFVVVARKLPQITAATPMRSWLYGIARRVAAASRRKAHTRREQLTGELPTVETPPDQHITLERRENLARLQAVLEAMHEDQRLAFVLREVEQLSLQEVADAMECPLQTAYSRVKVAKGKVAAAFADAEPEEVRDEA
ncbi:MAG: RNA polymerase sigma factor [Sorangiineae bacterium]|nr:RNA polymerase sigma factor [Polyangiaceae bacterium]MEB2322602.1 RNA polymerase sigma factor [Sorangiineae bacterium]